MLSDCKNNLTFRKNSVFTFFTQCQLFSSDLHSNTNSPASGGYHLHPKVTSACQKIFLFTRISTLQATDPISGIKSIDIMALNITMVTRPLYFVWMSYRGTHMLTGSLPEDGHSKSFNTARLGNNWKPLIVPLSLETSLAIKKIFRKM